MGTDDSAPEDFLTESLERSRLATEFCTSPAMERARANSLVATYRCRSRRCTLAKVYSTVHGIVVHQPAYKLSLATNEASSSADGRAHNTIDGERRWKPRSFFLIDGFDHTLNCDHVRRVVSAVEIRESATRRAGTVLIESD